MPENVRRVFLTFPQDLIKEPVIYNLGQNFKVVTNIRQANVEQDLGWMILELTGDENEIEKSLAYLREQKVSVEPAQGDRME